MELPKFLLNIALTVIALPLTLVLVIVRKAYAQAIFMERSL